MVTVVAITAILVLSVVVWYYNRPRPDDTQRMLFQGVEYIRDVREEPRPIIIHIVKIDLSAQGIAFFVTPAELEGEHMLAARTTSAFLEEFDLQIAINGDFFDPFYATTPFDYYPKAGDPVRVRGLSASLGDVYTTGYFSSRSYDTLFISAENVASFFRPTTIYNALSGWIMLVQNGVENVPNRSNSAYFNTPHPRSAVALDATGETLILVVVDGRQPNYSEGVTLEEMAHILIEYGATNALNLDGGGSSALVRAKANGSAHSLNSPIDNRIPGRERVIANHLGVYALPLE